jgi:hypothetical protein
MRVISPFARTPQKWLAKAVCPILILVVLLSGMQLAHAQTGDAQITMRCAIKSFSSTNPLNADEDSWKVLNLIYEGATRNNPATGERVPYIAVGSANRSQNTYIVSWSDCMVGNFGYSPKQTWEDPLKPEIIIFYDFEDVYWQDGVQMSVRDIMFSFHAQAGSQVPWLGNPLTDKAGQSNGNYSDSHWLFIQKIWESEDRSRAALKFVLQAPVYSVFDYYMSSYILPYHIWGTKASNQTMDNVKIWCDAGYNKSDRYSWKSFIAGRWPNSNPIGSGLFSWAGMSNNKISLVPWKGHFYKPGFKYYSYGDGIASQPKIGTLSLKIYTSEKQALMDLESDRLDYIAWDISPTVVTQFANDINIRAMSLRSTTMVYMGYNMRRKSFGYVREFDGLAPIYVDHGKPLRRALAHCIDNQAINVLANPVTTSSASLATFKSWENATAPAYSFDPAEAIRILTNAGYVLVDPSMPPGNGNWWSNPDGSAIGSGPGGRLELLITDSEHDSTRFQIGTMIVTQMRAVGINAELMPMTLADLSGRLGQRDFDMCIMAQDFGSLDRARPETYYYGSFHSDTVSDGPNYCGYNNESFDGEIDNAMAASDLELEKLHVRNAMASIAYDVPVNCLYYISNTEVYRSSNFVGMVDDGSGSLLNPDSMASATFKGKTTLRSRFIALPMTALSNSTLAVKVKVIDQNDDAVKGAEVKLQSTSGVLWNLSGMTDEYGMFSTNFTVPYVPLVETYNFWEAVTIYIKSATLDGYRDAPETRSVITVFPDRLRTLYIGATATQNVISDMDAGGNPGFTYVEIRVTDQSNMPVNGVSLAINISMQNLIVSDRTVRTDSGGAATIKLTAIDVNRTEECVITINATKTGFKNASQELTITIVPNLPEPEPVQEPLADRIAVPLAVAIISSALIGAAYIVRRRRR